MVWKLTLSESSAPSPRRRLSEMRSLPMRMRLPLRRKSNSNWGTNGAGGCPPRPPRAPGVALGMASL
jgi:hypothetical protein